MAGDWIKMRTDLSRHPKVCLMVDEMMDKEGKLARYVSQNCQCDMSVTRNVTRNACVGACVTVWGTLRHRGDREGDDLFVPKATIQTIDDIADLPGFGVALESVGWVVSTSKGLVFPRFFEEMNVDVEEFKQKNAERQKRYRERKKAEENSPKSDVIVTLRNALEREKEREKSNTHTHTPEMSEGFSNEWNRWCDFREAIDGRRPDPISSEANLMELTRRGPEKAKRDIDFSIRKTAKTILDSDNDFETNRSKANGSKPKRRLNL